MLYFNLFDTMTDEQQRCERSAKSGTKTFVTSTLMLCQFFKL